METTNPEGGLVQAYNTSYDQAFELALYGCQVLNFEVEAKNMEAKYIVASNGMGASSYGERIGIYFRKTGATETEIRVVSKPKVKTNIFAPNWENEFHQIIQARFEQLKGAKLLT